MQNKPIDETAARLGMAIRIARNNCQLSLDAAAVILRILPMELAAYESGIAPIPTDILQRITIMGYKLLQARRFDRRYVKMRRQILKMKQARKAASDN